MGEATGNNLAVKGDRFSAEQLRVLALEICAVLPPTDIDDPGELELLKLYRLMDEGRQLATRRYLAALI